MSSYVYCLCNPDTFEVRYVGVSDVPEERFKGHLTEHRKRLSNRKIRMWRAELGDRHPYLHVALECPDKKIAYAHEKLIIAALRAVGVDLWNIAPGGEGINFTEDLRAALSEFRKQLHADPEYAAKWKAARWTEEHREARSKQAAAWAKTEAGRALAAKTAEFLRSNPKLIAARDKSLRERWTPEFRARYGHKMAERLNTPEAQAKSNATKFGRKQSAETIAKRVAKNKGKCRTPEQKARSRAAWTPEKRAAFSKRMKELARLRKAKAKEK